MAGKIKAMWTNKDIRNRILFTLFAFLVYRLGSAITVPDVNTTDLVNGLGENSLFAMLNLLGGGGLEQFSVFALGVTPYITASIIIQLLSMDVIPHLTELSKAGANGRKTLDKYTRYLAVVFAFVQSFSLVYGFSKAYTGLIVGGVTISKILYIATIFAAGSMFLVWIGDQISMKGIGNGISMVIMAGIVGRMPQQFSSAWSSLISGESAPSYGAWLFAAYILIYLLIIIFVTLINTAERRIPIQYTSSSISLSKPSEANYLPLKVNSASVIPVIFASSLMMAPIQIASFFPSNDFIKEMQKWLGLKTWYSLVIYVLLILFFTFFYTKMQINPEKPSNTETHIELLEHTQHKAKYLLKPKTGKQHQLRVHLNYLGIPILHDPFYPTVQHKADDDFSCPLQLLAKQIQFVDPISQQKMHFISNFELTL